MAVNRIRHLKISLRTDTLHIIMRQTPKSCKFTVIRNNEQKRKCVCMFSEGISNTHTYTLQLSLLVINSLSLNSHLSFKHNKMIYVNYVSWLRIIKTAFN